MAALFRPLAARPALRRLPGARPAALARRPLLAPAMAAAGPARPVVTVCGTEPSAFGGETPFILLARVQVKPGMVDAYLEAAAAADKGVMESEPGMLHHTVSRGAPCDPLARKLALSQRNSVTLCDVVSAAHSTASWWVSQWDVSPDDDHAFVWSEVYANVRQFWQSERECLCKLHPRPAHELTRAAR